MNHVLKNPILLCTIISGSLIIACNDEHKSHSGVKEAKEMKASGYACPMHPEVIGKEGDTCPKCGMELEPASAATYKVVLTTNPKSLIAGERSQLSMAIQNQDKPVSLEIAHEKKLHLIVVDDNLTWFDHIHPEEQAGGTYNVSEIFPSAGKYSLFADYKPADAKQQVTRVDLDVTGNPGSSPAVVTGDIKLSSLVDGYSVSVANNNGFITGAEQKLMFSILKDGATLSAKDLEQYLGAVAHIVMISYKDKDYLHVHPGSSREYPIEGTVLFQQAGTYRVWVQFKIDGKVHTADFTIDVRKGGQATVPDPHNAHQH